MFVSKKKFEELEREYVVSQRQLLVAQEKAIDYSTALSDIVAQETAAPNATVTRILNIAKKALTR